MFDDICDVAIACGHDSSAPDRVIVCTADWPDGGMAHVACAACAPLMGALLNEVFGAHDTRPSVSTP